MNMKSLCVLVSTVICMAYGALADSIWQGGSGDWGVAANWDVAPAAGTRAVIPSGTAIVSPGDLDLVNSLTTIEVQSGATLKFTGTGFGGKTLTVKITGAGNFAAESCGQSGSKFALDGDCSGFTGPFDFTGCYVSVPNKAMALGTTNTVTISSPAAQAFSLGNFLTFGNSFVLSGGGTEALYAPYTVTITGKVTTRGTYVGLRGGANASYISTLKGGLHHDDTVSTTSDMNGTRITGFLRVTGDDLAHGLTGRDPKSAYPVFVDGTLYLKAPVSLRGLAYPGRIMVGGTMIFEKDECFDHSDANYSPEIMFGSHVANMKGSGTVDLNGTIQTVNVFYFYNGASGNYHLTSSKADGKLIMTKGGCTFNAKVEGQASVEYNSTLATPGVVAFNQASNTTSGGLHAKNGTIQVNSGISFPNLSLLKASNAGQLDIDSASVPNTVRLELSESGVLNLSDGGTLTVHSATVNGEPVSMGLHEAGEGSAIGSHLSGGSLQVLNGPIEEKTYTWTGLGGNANVTTPGNWDAAPDFTYPEAVRLVFGTAAARVVVNGRLSVNAVVISGSGLTLEGADANSSLEIRRGGLQMSNPNASGYVTNTISANIVFPNTDVLDWNTNDWTFGERVCARFTGTLSGGKASAATCLGGPVVVTMNMASGSEMTTAPRIEIVAANGQLDTALVFSNVILRAYDPWSLGSDSRYTTLFGNFNRPFETCEANTNMTPLRIRGQVNYLGAEGETFVQKGALTSYGATTAFFSGTILEGGVYNEYVSSGYAYPWAFYPSYENPIEIRGNPLSVPGKHVILGSGRIMLDSVNNAWTQFLFYGNNDTLTCNVANALPTTTHLYFKTDSDRKHYLILHGNDQTVQRAYALTSVAEGETQRSLEVHSNWPATISFIGSGDNFVVPVAFIGSVRFRWAGTGSYTLCNLLSTTTNGLEVVSGTLALKWNAGFVNATNVTVKGSGTLKIEESSAGVAFGGAKSKTELTVGDAGKLDLPADKSVMVYRASAQGEGLRRGTYGGPDAGLDAEHTVPWITGSGTLQVLKTSGQWGLTITIR